MLSQTPNFPFFITLSLLMSGTIFVSFHKKKFDFLHFYLILIITLSLINPGLLYLFNSILEYKLDSSLRDVLFIGDLFFLLLLGGLIASRSERILKKHIAISFGSLIFLTGSLFFFSVIDSVTFRHLVISFSMIILLLSICYDSFCSLSKLKFCKYFFTPIAICSGLSAFFWLSIFFLIINYQTYENIPVAISDNFINLWLILKSIFIFICFRFFDFLDQEQQQITSDFLIKNANKRIHQMYLARASFYKFPQPVLILGALGNVEFANEESIKLLNSGELNGKNIKNVFLTIEPSSSRYNIASIKLLDQTIRMFKIEKINFDNNSSGNIMLCLKNMDFDFQEFCQGVILKGGENSEKVYGLLDHNYAIYRMSSGWSELINPIDKFFHSGLIWDKLKLLSSDEREIGYLENSIASSSKSVAWLNIRSGCSLKIELEKLYAPDFRYFYLFTAQIFNQNSVIKKIESQIINPNLKTT